MNPFEKMELKKETFTKKEMIIYDLLHNDLEIILRSSATDLSKDYHVSQATITRFCQKLGYDGFNEFKFDVFRYQKQGVTSTLKENNSLDLYIHLINIIKQSIQQSQKLFANCPTSAAKFEIEGKQYVIVRHFTGQAKLENVVADIALRRADREMKL